VTGRVDIREVGPRDGLQSEDPLPAAERAELADRLIVAGCRHVEAVSFVSEKAVPAMAGASEVVASMRRRAECQLTGLVPNVRGAEAALAAGVDEITVTIAASPAYNLRNVNRTIDESLTEIAKVCELAAEASTPVDAVVSCAFGSPYEGEIAATDVAGLCWRLGAAGATTLTLADTTGMATPRVLRALLAETGTDVGLHLHETRGTALLNAYVALELGIRRFDTSVGGLGGSPFAKGAGGNLATEDFVALLDDMEIESGIDLGELLTVTAFLTELVGHPVPSRISSAGPRLPLA
jgi:hydroxymethylglutaryl-CoA lyase